jgi:hypothetical protein
MHRPSLVQIFPVAQLHAVPPPAPAAPPPAPATPPPAPATPPPHEPHRHPHRPFRPRRQPQPRRQRRRRWEGWFRPRPRPVPRPRSTLRCRPTPIPRRYYPRNRPVPNHHKEHKRCYSNSWCSPPYRSRFLRSCSSSAPGRHMCRKSRRCRYRPDCRKSLAGRRTRRSRNIRHRHRHYPNNRRNQADRNSGRRC